MTAIFKKELRTYFTSMTGYIFLTFLLLLTALFFVYNCVFALSPYYQNVLSATTMVFLILIPTLTMRLFSEEAKQKTDQLLYTAPLTITQIVLGKFFAAMALFLIGIGITALFPMMIMGYGEVPSAHILTAYIGYILMGACFIAIGLFISVLTDNQVIAAVATFAALFVLYIIDALAPGFPADKFSSLVFVVILIAGFAALLYNSTKNIYAGVITGAAGVLAAVITYFFNGSMFDALIYKFLQWFSLLSRFSDFYLGVINLADIIYFVSFTAAFVFLTTNVIEKRRWR